MSNTRSVDGRQSLPLGATEKGRLLLRLAAKRLADQGFRVHPLYGISKNWGCTCNDPNCRNPGKHPRLVGWQIKATKYSDKVDKDWDDHPDSNIGLATGKDAGMFCVDVDGLGGEETLATWEAEHGRLPMTCEDISGNGKRLFFLYPEGVTIPSRNGVLGRNVDVKADGGNVVGVGSQHVNGRVYKWRAGHAPWERELAEPPVALIEAVRDKKRLLERSDSAAKRKVAKPTLKGQSKARWQQNPVGKGRPWLRTIPVHQREETLFLRACELRNAGISKDKVLDAILGMNARWCEHPEGNEFSEREAEKAVDSAFSYNRQPTRKPELYLHEAPMKIYLWFTEKAGGSAYYKCSRQEIAKAVNIHRNTVSKGLKTLVEYDLVIEEPIGRNLSLFYPVSSNKSVNSLGMHTDAHSSYSLPVLAESTGKDPYLVFIETFLHDRRPSTLSAYRTDLEDFRGFINEENVHAAVQRFLDAGQKNANRIALEYRSHLVGRGLKPATINRRLSVLRNLTKLAQTTGLIHLWPVLSNLRNLKDTPYRSKGRLPESGFKKILRQFEQRTDRKGIRDRAILCLLGYVGLKRGQLVSLDLSDIDPLNETLAVRGKSSFVCIHRLCPPVMEALRMWINVRGSEPGPLFVNLSRDPRVAGSRLTSTAVYQIVQKCGQVVELRVTPHRLRRKAGIHEWESMHCLAQCSYSPSCPFSPLTNLSISAGYG